MTLYAFKNIQPKMDDSVFLAPTAQIIGDVHIGQNSSVWFQTVIRGIPPQSPSVKEQISRTFPCAMRMRVSLKIGNGVTVGHQCCLHGCTIEDDCLIGMGATVMNQAVIGTGSVIAAGAVCWKNNYSAILLVIGSWKGEENL
ncbi:MAG: gamma carbonic anhydrase family protein [Desulfobacterales bacterium]